MDRQTLRDWIPAYALGALDADERRQIEACLQEDESARQLLDEYRLIVDSLALTAPALAPPAHLEDKLRQRLRQKTGRGFHWRPLLEIAAVFLAVLAGIFLFDHTRNQPTLEDLYTRLVADPKAVQVALIPDFDPTIEGTLIYREDDALAVIRVSNLPELEADQIFQIWMVDADGPTSGGTHQLSSGVHYIEVPITKPVTEYLRFGMSVEPAPGSPFGNRPSGPRLFNIPIESH